MAVCSIDLSFKEQGNTDFDDFYSVSLAKTDLYAKKRDNVQVLNYISRGSQAKVFRVLLDKTECAMKEYVGYTIGMPDSWEAYNKEIQVLKSLQGHANIPKVFDNPYPQDKLLFMELGDYTLRDWIDKKQSTGITSSEFFHIAEQLFSTLLFLQSKGKVHRDIKPENILIMDKSLRICLADFGLITDMNQEVDVYGTYCYRMPALQFKLWHTYTGEEDIYSSLYTLKELPYDRTCPAIRDFFDKAFVLLLSSHSSVKSKKTIESLLKTIQLNKYKSQLTDVLVIVKQVWSHLIARKSKNFKAINKCFDILSLNLSSRADVDEFVTNICVLLTYQVCPPFVKNNKYIVQGEDRRKVIQCLSALNDL